MTKLKKREKQRQSLERRWQPNGSVWKTEFAWRRVYSRVPRWGSKMLLSAPTGNAQQDAARDK